MGTSVEWVEEWSWVAGYSTVSTLVVIFNLLLFFSVIKNKFLHYGTHYVVVALSLRNLARVGFTLWLVFLSKMIGTPWLYQQTFHSPTDQNLTKSDSMPVMCQVMSFVDIMSMSCLMFYLAGLSIYMFCRHPNPPIFSTSDTTLKLYGLNSGIKPVEEKGWKSALLILLPPLLSAILSLPVPLLPRTHPMTAVPRGTVCEVPDHQLFDTYQSSITILGFYLPAAIVICLLMGLSIRRCVSCSSGVCVSSFCKEEMTLGFLAASYIVAFLALHLPILDFYLTKLELPQTGIQPYLLPEIARATEMSMGILLPIFVYMFLPAYRSFSSSPDSSDLNHSKDDIYHNHSATAPDSPGLSHGSIDNY